MYKVRTKLYQGSTKYLPSCTKTYEFAHSGNHIEIAPAFSGILFGITNTFGNMPGFLGPIIAGWILENRSGIDGWQFVFWIGGLFFKKKFLISSMFAVLFSHHLHSGQHCFPCLCQVRAATLGIVQTFGGVGRVYSYTQTNKRRNKDHPWVHP